MRARAAARALRTSLLDGGATTMMGPCGMHLRALTLLCVLASCAPPDLDSTEIRPGELPLPPRKDDPADGGDAAASASSTSIVGLLDAYESVEPRIASLAANAGFATVHAIDVDAEADDVLRIFGQIEVTSDFARPVNITLRARVDGAIVVGNMPTENAVVTGSHHVPLWVDAVYRPATKDRRRITLEVAAARSDATPSVIVERGYGHLVVEHYRRFPDRSALAIAGARGVASISSDRKARTLMFGGSFMDRALPFMTTTDVRGGDIVRVHGTSTSRTPSGEMHGLGVFINTTKRIGPWATKNGVADSPDVPLIVDAVDRPVADGSLAYNLSMHGVFNRGGAIVDGGGGLDALVFRKPAEGQAARAPSDFIATTVTPSALDVVANAPPIELMRVPLGHLAAETPIRVAVHVNAAPTTSGFTIPVGCTLRATIDNSASAKAPVIHQVITPLMASAALAMRTVLTTATDGEPSLRVIVSCTRADGASAVVKMLGANVVAEPLIAR